VNEYVSTAAFKKRAPQIGVATHSVYDLQKVAKTCGPSRHSRCIAHSQAHRHSFGNPPVMDSRRCN